MERFDLTPYRRSTVGFDRLFDLLENQVRGNAGDNYPPFNIERQGEDVYGQTLARVSVDRRDVADQLVAEGQVLAYQRGSAAKLDRLAQWCGTTAALESVGKS